MFLYKTIDFTVRKNFCAKELLTREQKVYCNVQL